MVKAQKQIITGFGSVPARPGTVTFGQNINLLDMPDFVFCGHPFYDSFSPLAKTEKNGIGETQKIAYMRFIDSNILRVAVAEYGFFLSSSLLVFDIDISKDRIFILGTYRFDNSFSDRKLFSVHVLPSGDIVVAGRRFELPFLCFWQNGHFTEPVYYGRELACGKIVPAFSFVLPLFHSDLKEVPASYSILQYNGSLVALVAGVSGESPYCFATFDQKTLKLTGTHVPEKFIIPPVLDMNKIRGGLIGCGTDSLILQWVGCRKNKCSSFFVDGIIQKINPKTFDFVPERNNTNGFGRNYKDLFGPLNGLIGQDIKQASVAFAESGTDKITIGTESFGLFQLDLEAEKINSNKCLALTVKNNKIYSLELTRQGLGLSVYIF